MCFVFKFNLPFVFSTINYFKTLSLKLVVFWFCYVKNIITAKIKTFKFKMCFEMLTQKKATIIVRKTYVSIWILLTFMGYTAICVVAILIADVSLNDKFFLYLFLTSYIYEWCNFYCFFVVIVVLLIFQNFFKASCNVTLTKKLN